MIEKRLTSVIRDIPDFPKPGILFKDITPIFKDPQLCSDIVTAFAEKFKGIQIDVVAGIECRGFLFGLMLANQLNLPFILIRKSGKLPHKTVKEVYNLEYGSATIEMHADALDNGQKVLIHDDLLATGGTVEAASKLIRQSGGEIAGYCFLISLDFLNGRQKLQPFSDKVVSLVNYP